MDDRTRLLARIRKRCTIDEVTKCWIWGGATGLKGYGRIKVNGRLALTHRVAAFAVGRCALCFKDRL